MKFGEALNYLMETPNSYMTINGVGDSPCIKIN